MSNIYTPEQIAYDVDWVMALRHAGYYRYKDFENEN